jgi:MFS family permease
MKSGLLTLIALLVFGDNHVSCSHIVPITLQRPVLRKLNLKAQNAPEILYNQKRVRDSEEFSVHYAEMLGVPKITVPAFAAFILDSIAVGLVMPCLPFFVASFGANTFHLSMILSVNFAAQMIGSVAMGRVSDTLGRKRALQVALGISALGIWLLGRANSIPWIFFARICSGSSGGLIPIMQACVIDTCSKEDREKYLGRIQAAFGAGIIVGPLLNMLFLSSWSVRSKLLVSTVFPLVGLAVTTVSFRDSRPVIAASTASPASVEARHAAESTASAAAAAQSRVPLILLKANGFALMYAFATEGIYAMLMKDSFGLGETALSYLFASCGIIVFGFQVFLIKTAVIALGKLSTLMLGNALLAAGMAGVAVIRSASAMRLHFAMFAVHVLGYSIADTALVSLLSDASMQHSIGRDLALNQAIQAGARIVSPLVAGFLYEFTRNKVISGIKLPVGAASYLFGAVWPGAAAIALLIFQVFVQKTPLSCSLLAPPSAENAPYTNRTIS